MKIRYQKRPEGLVPATQPDLDKHDLLKNGDYFEKGFKKLRNPEYHKLVFKFLSFVFEFQDEFDDFELFRKRVKWLSGCYSCYMIDDKMITELDSWDFEKCDQYQFQDIFKRVKNCCWSRWVHNTDDQDEIERRCNILLTFD